MPSYPDYPEHLIVQVILSAQARGDDAMEAAEKAAEAYVAGLAAFKKAQEIEDPNARYLQAAAQQQSACGPKSALSSYAPVIGTASPLPAAHSTDAGEAR